MIVATVDTAEFTYWLSVNNKMIDDMIGYAINYFNNFVKPNKKYRLANPKETSALKELNECLNNFRYELDPEVIQTEIYRIGKEHNFDPLRGWFSYFLLYTYAAADEAFRVEREGYRTINA